ncbi:MAG TPA: GMC family oxidoreductase, partial [Kineosporiaceae bacterium]|nr:GMC family oxidoreductase [Kineosporiaceae bacterium]
MSHPRTDALISLSPYQGRTLAALVDRIFPADENGPAASEIGVVTYVDRALSGFYREHHETYRLGLRAVDDAARARHGAGFPDLAPEQQDELVAQLWAGTLKGLVVPHPEAFARMLLEHVQEGLFADPAHGGNRDKLGWRFLGHPGLWLEHGPDEHLADEPVTKGGEVRDLADAGWTTTGELAREPIRVAGYAPQRGAAPPADEVDVVVVGMGAVGGFVAPMLAGAGLRVVGLEAGPYRTAQDFVPDELNAAYYCRGDMGPKFQAERPRWRPDADTPSRPAAYTLGRMMNGIGGSVAHWGGALRRYHPHHFAYRSWIVERFGADALPENTTVIDWPLTYEDLEPYYTYSEHVTGVSGSGSANPFGGPRSKDYPMPPLREFKLGLLWERATREAGLHPYPTPICMNSRPYNGQPATAYHPWSGGFGPFANDRWNPLFTSVPQALASGNLDLRTHCRVVRVLTDRSGHADGVEYVDPAGDLRVQRARTVILASYTFENLRLMFLSGGLGDGSGQLGRNFMTKFWSDVYGLIPGEVFNEHTGPAAQMWGIDDFQQEGFDAFAHGFVGGATFNVENQKLPIGIARDPLPPDVQPWGKPYKDHLRRWQSVVAVRIQPDALPYTTDYVDLDPTWRDTSGLGLPVVRVTCALRPNEDRLLAWMQGQAAEILRRMGATTTWPTARFRGVLSSHDLGGARMGLDPATSVVDPDLQVHD